MLRNVQNPILNEITNKHIQMINNLYWPEYNQYVSMYFNALFLGSLASSGHVRNRLCCCEVCLGCVQRQPLMDTQSLHSASSLMFAKLYHSTRWQSACRQPPARPCTGIWWNPRETFALCYIWLFKIFCWNDFFSHTNLTSDTEIIFQ